MKQLASTYAVCDVLYVGQCINQPSLFSAQNEAVEVTIHNDGPKTLKFGHQLVEERNDIKG